MKNVKLGIVGTANIAKKFMSAMSGINGIKATALYSRTEERAAEFCTGTGIPEIYTDYSAFLASDIDAVYIATPNIMHDVQAIKAMKAGKHVLCEKIIATSLSKLCNMIKAAQENGVVLLEAMRPDFDPATEVIRAEIKKLGKIRHASLEYCQYSSRYDSFLAGNVMNAFDPSLENSALDDIGIYPLRMAVSLFSLPQTVGGASVLLHNGFDGAGIINLSYPEMLVNVTYSKITRSVNPCTVVAEEGSLVFDRINSPNYLKKIDNDGNATNIKIPYLENNMRYEIEAFLAAINGKLDHREYLELSRKTLLVHDEFKRNRTLS